MMMLQTLGRFIQFTAQMLSEAQCMLGASLAAEEIEVNKTDSPLWALWLPASRIIPLEHIPAVIPFATDSRVRQMSTRLILDSGPEDGELNELFLHI